MEHLLILFYALLLGTGFTGISMLTILYNRLKDKRVLYIIGIMALLSGWLLIHLIAQYWQSVMLIRGVHQGSQQGNTVYGVLTGINQLLGLFVYIGVLVGLMRIDKKRRKQAGAAFLPLILWIILTAAAQGLPPLYRLLSIVQPCSILISVVLVCVFLLYTGIRLRAVSLEKTAGQPQTKKNVQNKPQIQSKLQSQTQSLSPLQSRTQSQSRTQARSQFKSRLSQLRTTDLLIYRLGIITILFVPAALTAVIIFFLVGSRSDPTPILNYLFYTAWNVISIIIFFRYITQPSALVEDGGSSEAFIKHYKITKREKEIIDLISHGLTNKEIASELNVSLTTVRTHIYNVFKKAEVQSRVELLRMMSGYRE